ncbi:ABC transporter permease [Parendozoicomonas sp. Alg238-R29]|uniref:PhnE/PtxC family ABC transporter permease n=1 Tax=Parendozoicomonas sp. Alg238-R29 TaxID=2993446 RepID=UPI00248E1D3B|nr:ABC transporter permease [Parendozoicomonas sp. Alg238-R29]
MNNTASHLRNVSLLILLSAVVCVPFADFEITAPDFWGELALIGHAALNPEVISWTELLVALANTLSFAFQGVALGAMTGFLLALAYRFSIVRSISAFLRAIHELFWALIFIQVAGLSSLTGLLALAIPYAGTFAKVFGEIFEETNKAPAKAIRNGGLSGFLYTTLPLAWKRIVDYTGYRFECGIRSSAVLGFVGLPTLGFYMETLFKQGEYSQAMAMLYALFVVIGSARLWLKRKLLPFYIVAAFIWLPPTADISWLLVWQFFTYDIVPAPLRTGYGDLSAWLWMLLSRQAVPGVVNTVLLTQISLAATLLLSLVLFPFHSKLFAGKSKILGHGLLVVMRTTPEYLLAFLGVIVIGPSMLPGIFALGVHNAGILAHLIGRYVDEFKLRDDAPRGMLLYLYEVLPRVYKQFLALLLYRWEVIQRESAILGILGISTLGFYIDSAFEELRMDRAFVLILITALLNIGTDALARYLRNRNV